MSLKLIFLNSNFSSVKSRYFVADNDDPYWASGQIIVIELLLVLIHVIPPNNAH